MAHLERQLAERGAEVQHAQQELQHARQEAERAQQDAHHAQQDLEEATCRLEVRARHLCLMLVSKRAILAALDRCRI